MIADRVKMVIQDSGLSLPQFSSRTGIKKSTLVNYRDGVYPPTASFLERVCSEFLINPQWLLLGTGPMKVSPLPEPLPPPTVALDGFPSDAEFHEAKGFSIQEDLNIAAKVLVSDTPYAVALHLNIRSFGDALQQRDDMKAMKETLRDQSRTIMRLQEEAETIKQERQEEKKEAVSMRKEVEELKAQLARLLSTGGDCPDHSEEVA